MSNFGGAEGSGVHPGKPIIWPTGKSQQNVSSSPQVQVSGQVKTSSSAATSQTAQTSAPSAATSSSAAQAAASRPNVARPMTLADLKAILTKMQIPDTQTNVQIASLLLKNGMEISKANIVKILTMLKGTDGSMNTKEAAVLMNMKGVDSANALQVLSDFLSQNPQMAAQLQNLQQAIMNLNSALGISKGLLDANLQSQLSALLSQVDESVKNLGKKYQFSGNNTENLQGFLGKMRGLKALLEGVQQKAVMNDSAEAQVLSANLSASIEKTKQVIRNLTAQGILSQKGEREEANYLYQQIPNAMAKNKSDIELVISRDGKGSKSAFDPENTKIIMGMETENLGKMVCMTIVKGKRVYVIFTFNAKEFGDEARKLIADQYASLQKNLSEKDYVVSGYQVKVDPALCSVKSYMLPIVRGLEEQLRRIDMEA